MIDIIKFEHRVNLLKNGKALLLTHLVYGDYVVRMNPQQNRIFCEATLRGDTISEERINYLLMWDCGEWYLYEPPVLTKCHCCDGTGVSPVVKTRERV